VSLAMGDDRSAAMASMDRGSEAQGGGTSTWNQRRGLGVIIIEVRPRKTRLQMGGNRRGDQQSVCINSEQRERNSRQKNGEIGRDHGEKEGYLDALQIC
jgi:hypothetical protein